MPWSWACHWILERAALTGREIVADIGAGDNPIMLQAYQAGRRESPVYLIDNLRQPSGHLKTYLQRIVADAASVPLPPASVDVAISISVLEHVPPGKRAEVLREVARLLKPGGKALLSIGLPMQVTPEAEALLKTLPFFVDRGCAVYMPIDLREIVSASPDLVLAEAMVGMPLPGYEGFDEEALLRDPGICVEEWHTYKELREYPPLLRIRHCEIGVVLQRV
jgi:SAM-dependent methyltransferase